jgi:hypothetical protein
MDWSKYSSDLPEDEQEVEYERRQREQEQLEAEAANSQQYGGYDY